MEAVKVNVPPGYKAVFDEQNSVINFTEKPKNVMERIKSFEDVLKELGLTESDVVIPGLTDDEIAYRQIKHIATALNEGWVPDWGDDDEYKYRQYFNMGGSSGSRFSYYDYGRVCSHSTVGSRLCFKSRELAEYAAKQFPEVYKKFFLINQ